MAAPRRANPDRVIDAALALAAERPWRRVTLSEIAKEAEMRLDQLHSLFRSKAAILDAFTARIDAQVMRGTDEEAAAEPVRDRLFDVLARRFEALQPHRAALASIVCEGLTVPREGYCGTRRLLRSMTWSLETAGVGGSGPFGELRVRGLAALFMSSLFVFLRDDSPDLARTMAHLDRNLSRADRLMGRLNPRRAQAATP
ncbi:MAG: TetR family transcriptional regulator [Defluviicoccus sp.]|nr:TetR family transcriptional regulator [Defluviicoccus sp.]MDE0383831.1 TetR family transcriptional regulator [Defluviicoccus sp.]